MTPSDLSSYIQIGISLGGFLVMLGYYKAAFSHHEKILDRHEQAINAIIVRLDNMNAESNFFKGFMAAKQ